MVIDVIIKKGYKQTELGVIPEDWEVKKLGEIGEITGAGIDKKLKSDEIPVRLVNYLDVFHKNFIYSKDLNHWVTAPVKQFRRCAVKKGDIFFTPSSEMRYDIGISAVAMEDIPDAGYSYHVDRLRLFDDWDLAFRTYIFKTKYFLDQAETICEGSGKRYVISLTKFREMTVRYPVDKSEQTAIAVVLSDTDALIEYLGKLIAKKKAIKQGAMQQLLTGKKRLPGFSGKWDVKTLGEIGKTYGGLSGKKKSDFYGGKYPYIPFMNIMSNPVIDLQYFDYVNIRGDEKQNKAIKDDLFFNGSSETPEEVGMCSVLQGDIPNLYLNSFCFGFRLNRDLKTDGLYLSYFFRSPMGRQLIFSLAQGATRYNLSKINFMKLKIPYPDPIEQTAIAAILSDMDAEIESLEQKRDKYAMLKQGMMQQLLTGRIRIYANN